MGNDSKRAGVCRHGALRRSCETCDLAEDLAKVEAERDALRRELAEVYAEMRKQRPAITAVFDRDVWEQARKWEGP